MDVSIIIVNYKTFDLTKNTINSILNQKFSFSYEIIVVDNASNDGSLEKLKNHFKSKVNFISSLQNNGFSSANNMGIKIAKGNYILLLNSDTIVKEHTLENIYNYLEKNQDVGVVGCKILLPDGNLDKAC
ncbi:glycosyltransferase, partial [Methanobrevibacter sp. OttesenSCG-928-I08]|nr:glycosyltransferase [Methanobrevibacter sp. OttesenSCG-928-I08]